MKKYYYIEVEETGEELGGGGEIDLFNSKKAALNWLKNNSLEDICIIKEYNE